MHPDFVSLLLLKDSKLIELFTDLREFILDIYPDSNELLYHTHALTAAFSISERLTDTFCMLPIYTNHVNLGFYKGTLLDDHHNLLKGTGNLIRHIPIVTTPDYRIKEVKALVKAAVEFAIADMDTPSASTGQTISKIKTSK